MAVQVPLAGSYSSALARGLRAFPPTTSTLPLGSNVAIGYQALYQNISGNSNIAIGNLALNANTGSANATLLPNGRVLAAAGINGSNFLASAEVYDSASGN